MHWSSVERNINQKRWKDLEKKEIKKQSLLPNQGRTTWTTTAWTHAMRGSDRKPWKWTPEDLTKQILYSEKQGQQRKERNEWEREEEATAFLKHHYKKALQSFKLCDSRTFYLNPGTTLPSPNASLLLLLSIILSKKRKFSSPTFLYLLNTPQLSFCPFPH